MEMDHAYSVHFQCWIIVLGPPGLVLDNMLSLYNTFFAASPVLAFTLSDSVTTVEREREHYCAQSSG